LSLTNWPRSLSAGPRPCCNWSAFCTSSSPKTHTWLRAWLLELPNLLALLDWLPADREPADVSQWAGHIEQLLARLGRPAALALAVAVRETAAKELGDWSHAAYQAADSAFDRLAQNRDLSGAHRAAQLLLERCLTEGEQAYVGADYDTAMAHFNIGHVLKMGGAAAAALEPLVEAQRRFEALGDARAGMASACLTEQGDCLRGLGRLDDAAVAYEEAIARDGKAGRDRNVAVGKGQLGTVRMLQRLYPEALAAHQDARGIFERLGEPASVATAWHQIGRVHEEAGRHEPAERAYRKSLAVKVQHGLRSGEASSLGQLGSLYDTMGRREEAVTFYRQAADIYVELGDQIREGVCRSNLAGALTTLRRYPEARPELHRAIECDEPYGHAAEPWTTWMILHNLELGDGNPDAAASARTKAIRLFSAYRRDGGENLTGGQTAKLCEGTLRAITDGKPGIAQTQLRELQRGGLQDYLQVVVPKLDAILSGSRDPALSDDPDLDYDDAAELRLLLEHLGVTFPGEE